jgi:CO dehydrogenase/acetyl-CoA synthase epsilon subunit
MSLKDTIADDALAEKIVRYYGYTEEGSLKHVAKTVAKLMINEYFDNICSGNFKNLTDEEMREWVTEELNQRFDEKVVAAVEQSYPHLSESEIDAKVAAIESLYRKEHEAQVEAVTKARIQGISKPCDELAKRSKNPKEKIYDLVVNQLKRLPWHNTSFRRSPGSRR